MGSQRPKFVITREDQVVDPVTFTLSALRVGRQVDCEVVLNHPTVSRLQAGINEVDGRFYIINLSPTNLVTLNGRVIEFNEPEALADGDFAQIGSYFLNMNRTGESLTIHVQFQVAANIPEGSEPATPESPMLPESDTAPAKVADALKEFWDKRSRDKAARPSPLHPKRPVRPGKAQFNWTPTRDLLRPWPASLFMWGVVLVGALSVMAAVWYTNAFSPGPVSRAHSNTTLVNSTPATAIAIKANSNSCTSCHSINARLEVNCASCHETKAFSAKATGIPEHNTAGIGCTSCHSEHQGLEFKPVEAALRACSSCHSSENKKLFGGRSLKTPHGGTVGYPVVNGVWVWQGLSNEAWQQRAAAMSDTLRKASEKTAGETDDAWRSRQFHALHVHRVFVRDVALKGNVDGEMSCSSCHKSFDPIDRVTPATTCAACHNGNNGQVAAAGQTVISAGAPNCSSCHIQHIKMPGFWNPRLLVVSSQ